MNKHTINFTKLQLSVINKIYLSNFEQKQRSFWQSNFKKVSNIYPFFHKIVMLVFWSNIVKLSFLSSEDRAKLRYTHFEPRGATCPSCVAMVAIYRFQVAMVVAYIPDLGPMKYMNMANHTFTAPSLKAKAGKELFIFQFQLVTFFDKHLFFVI